MLRNFWFVFEAIEHNKKNGTKEHKFRFILSSLREKEHNTMIQSFLALTIYFVNLSKSRAVTAIFAFVVGDVGGRGDRGLGSSSSTIDSGG